MDATRCELCNNFGPPTLRTTLLLQLMLLFVGQTPRRIDRFDAGHRPSDDSVQTEETEIPYRGHFDPAGKFRQSNELPPPAVHLPSLTLNYEPLKSLMGGNLFWVAMSRLVHF